MKYYGLKDKIKKEEFLYKYAKAISKAKSILPGKRRSYWKRHFEYAYRDRASFGTGDNSLPPNHSFYLDSIVVSDLIRREDIGKLQKGIRKLLKKYRSGRFLSLTHDGLDELCKKLEHMDSTLSSWYSKVECGCFEFKDSSLKSKIDHYSLSICNVNSAFLSLEFNIHLSDEKQSELNELIRNNYKDQRGYAKRSLVGKGKVGGAFESFSNVQYNDNYLKADQIYEFLSFVEWEFFEALHNIFPFVLHGKGIMPPRIELYYTDIDHRETYDDFFSSIGICPFDGQFINDKHKMFFRLTYSGRYEEDKYNARLLYIIKDDGIAPGRFESVKDKVYLHMKDYDMEYFRMLFLRLLTEDASKKTIGFKQKLDKIKLKKNKLCQLLKLKYKFSLVTDDYNRYIRDDCCDNAIHRLSEVYAKNEAFMSKTRKLYYIVSYRSFCEFIKQGKDKVKSNIATLMQEFEDKKQILQNLSDYKNTEKSIWLNIFMLFIAAVTLFFVVFPDYATELAEVLVGWKMELQKLIVRK